MTMRQCLTLCLVALFSGLGALTAGSAQALVVRTVRVENQGPGRVDEASVMAYTTVRAGSELDRAAVSRDVHALLDTGRFTDVNARVVMAGGDAVDVVYGIVNRWRLAAVPAIEGATRYRESRLRDWIALEPGDLVDDAVIGNAVRKVTEEYRKDFFPDVSVTWRIEPLDSDIGSADVTIVVDEGRKAKVKRFVFEGNHNVSDRDLLDAVRYPNWWNPFRVFHKLETETDDLAMMRAAFRDVYLNRGYLDAAVSLPEVRRDERGRLRVFVSISEGEQYHVGSITMSGVTLFPEQDVAKQIVLHPGEVAALNAIDASADGVRDYFGGRGYLGTRVRPVLTPEPQTRTATVELAVREGVLTDIRNIEIRGNGRTKDKVIRRELLVNPGDQYNEVRVRTSERRLRNLGYFSRVNAYPVETPWPDQKDIVVEVEEKPTGQFMVGAGFSSIDKVIGFVELSQGNFDIAGWPRFTGGGQKLKLRTQLGSTRTEYDVSFVEPWFLDRKLSLSLDFYRTDVEYSDYDVSRVGFSAGLAKPLPWNNRLELRYRIENYKVTDVADTNEYIVVDTGESYYFDDEQDDIDSSLTLALSHDTRNSPFTPSRGEYARGFYTVSGGPMGFDIDMYRAGVSFKKYVSPWFNHVISLRTRYEVVEAYGDTAEVPLTERLYLGGGRTVRGFEYRDVGPKAVEADDEDGTSYRALGGKSLAFASIEYTIPIVKGIRFATFYDTGNVWRDAYELDPGDLASSAGVGIRFDMPGFPIRIDRAWVIQPDDDLTGSDAWAFWIGYDY
jgi:outer membrane protein insertion porin family